MIVLDGEFGYGWRAGKSLLRQRSSGSQMSGKDLKLATQQMTLRFNHLP
jgi:hypothetical protein